VTELSIAAGTRPRPAHGVSLGRALQVWLRVAALSFGGPAGQIAVMHRIIVDEKKWVGESRFLHALSYCMLLPGPEAQQLATYIGWLMHRWPGAIMAGGLFVLPGVIAIMALSWVYAAFGQLPIVIALFFGLKAAVLAIVLQAVHRVGSRALKTGAIDRARGCRLCRHLFRPCALSAYRARRRHHRFCGCTFWFVRFCGRGGTQLQVGSNHREPSWR
jgi:chromate transporter